MRKHRTILMLASAAFVFALVFSAASCRQTPTLPSQELALVAAPGTPEPSIEANDLGTCYVFITESGTKYHRRGCRYLSESKKRVTLDWAKSHGYKRCSVCKPPRRCP
ncbi:MAG: hypothetical protein AB1714_31940 [Acidobacteriota bacterium]